MNESIKNLLERRSIRAYKKDLVPQETLDVILKAGEYSPSGMGQQSTLMVVTQDPDLVAKLSRMNADVMGSKSDPFYGAPTVIIVFSDSKMGTCVENGSSRYFFPRALILTPFLAMYPMVMISSESSFTAQ